MGISNITTILTMGLTLVYLIVFIQKMNRLQINEHCEKSISIIFVAYLIGTIISRTAENLVRLQVDTILNSGHYSGLLQYSIIIFIIGLITNIIQAIFFMKIDEKFLYNLTGGKLGKIYIVVSILSFLISGFLPGLNLVIVIIYVLICISKLRKNLRVIPSTSIYSSGIIKGLAVIGIFGLISSITTFYFSFLYGFRYYSLQWLMNILYVAYEIGVFVGIVFLGKAFLISNQVPLVTCKNRSIYAGTQGGFNEPHLNSPAVSYQFGTPRPSNFSTNSVSSQYGNNSSNQPQVEAQFCKKCGKMMEPSAIFCPNCGNSK